MCRLTISFGVPSGPLQVHMNARDTGKHETINLGPQDSAHRLKTFRKQHHRNKSPDVDKMKDDFQRLPHAQIALQSALPRVHTTVVYASVTQPGYVNQEKGRGSTPALVYRIVVEVLGLG